MIETMTTMTAQTPSSSGMPINGSASGSALGHLVVGADKCALATPVVRDRKLAAATGSIVSPDQAYFPGTRAWRPPGC